MININALCQYCFLPADKTKPVCPYCGNDPAKVPERGERCLPQNSVLVGRYLIGRVLGEGGFGITYLALDMLSEKRAAVKEFFPDHLASRDSVNLNQTNITIRTGDASLYFQKGLRSFRQEAETLQKFRQLPGIVSILDFFAENNTAYFVMDYIDGISMKQYLRRYINETGRPLPYTKAFAFMRPVLKSLEMVHEAGIIHRDISPENILIDRNGQVTLIDFGSARAERLVKENLSMTVMVKHGYAPEEQYRTHGNQGAWTDVYAVCATLYHMISGIRPEEAIERLIKDQVVPLKNLPADKTAIPVPQQYSDIIEKGMQPRAEDRYQTLDEMLADLDAADKETGRRQNENMAAGSPPQTGRPGGKRKTPVYGTKPSRSRKSAGAVAAAIVLLIAAGMLLFFHLNNRGSAAPEEGPAASSAKGSSSVVQEDNTGSDSVSSASAGSRSDGEAGAAGESTEVSESTKVAESTKAGGSTEVSESTEAGESTEVSESTKVGESTKAGGSTEVSESTEVGESSEINETSEAAGVNDSSQELSPEDDHRETLRITQQPEDVAAQTGDMIRLSIAAEGDDIAYTWQYSRPGDDTWQDVDTGCAGGETLALVGDKEQDGYSYRCIAADKWGEEIISQSVTVSVRTPLQITRQPEDVTSEVDDIASFHVEAEGDDLTYQWEYCPPDETKWKSSTAEGNKTDTLAFMAKTGLNRYSYRCRITDAAGETVISDAFTLTVKKGAIKGSAEVGSYITFGAYEQDNDLSNGKEAIEWLVLERDGDRALLISRYALDCQPYNTEYRDVTWETCSLRSWLNDTFIDEAFSSDGQEMVQTTRVTADKNPYYDISPGNDTWDKVFLLSIPEAEEYFRSDEDRMCAPTDYAIAQGAYRSGSYTTGGRAACWWWLRSPGYRSNCAASVGGGGEIYGYVVYYGDYAVRPALWIDLKS